MRKTFLGLGLVFLCSLMHSPGTGVTVITHGWSGNITGWVLPMCRALRNYQTFPGTNYTLYKISITKPSGYLITPTQVEGAKPFASDSGEILVALDWSTISGTFQPSTAEIGAQAAAALLSTSLIPDLNGRALAELPLHLVGHSRGGSMMAEVAKVLGAQGVWVDHLTLLDPFPLSLNSDPTLRNYANVFFTENFRQNTTFPTGQTLGGAYDRLLTMLAVGGYDPGSEHSDVHLWYHGTVDLSTPVLVDQAMITGSERVAWWTMGEQEGTNAGFHYSLVGRGNRFITTDPAGSSGKISDGINKFWDLGAGQSANRKALPSNNGSWPNIVRLFLPNGDAFVGSPATCRLYYQHGTSSADTATLELFLDRDSNPWNTNETSLGSASLPGTGTAAVTSVVLPFQAPPSLPPGAYRLFAKTSFAGRSRIFYATERVISAPVLANAHYSSNAFTFTAHWQSGDSIITEVSTDLSTWAPGSTNTLHSKSELITMPATANPAFYRLRIDGL